MNTIGHWVGGRVVAGSSGRTAPVFDPARGVQTGEVALASATEVGDFVKVAVDASAAWGASASSYRAGMLFRLRELIDAHRDELAAIVTREHGKVLDDARGEVARGLECVEFACGVPHLLKGAHSSEVSRGIDVHTVLQPVGVVVGITPFNFPVMVPLWMLANALACGNAFVLKPSEKDPSASLLLADLVQRAGFPDGVFNVVQGDVEAVDALLCHPDVDAVSFVGSTAVARHVYETGTRHGKRVQALGGAKNHMVVLPDADIDAAADAAISAAYGSAGERCMAISVVVAVGAVADPLVDAIATRIPDVVIGSGDDAASMMGPLITAEHRDRVRSYVERAPDEGATVVVDGTTVVSGDGFFVGCSLVDGVEPGMRVYDDEIFGPVLSVVRVANLDDALGLVNANPVRERCRAVHARRWRGAAVRARGAGRHDRDQRADPGARRVTLVRWLEGLAVRRHHDVRAGRHPLLHPPQGRHLALARARNQRHRSRLPVEPLTASASVTSIDELLAEARAFLDATCTLRNESDQKFVWGEGSDRVNILEEVDPAEASVQLADAKRYAAARFDAGFGWIDGPVEYGGRGLTLEHARAYQELEANYELPNLSMLTIAIGFIGPALLAHAAPEVRAAYLPQALPRRSRDVSALQRAERGLRPRRRRDACGARRRRVGRERPEGVDVERARGRPGARGVPDRSRRAQAPGPHHVPGRHARARRGGAAAASDDRDRGVQRGVPHRRARARLAPGG